MRPSEPWPPPPAPAQPTPMGSAPRFTYVHGVDAHRDARLRAAGFEPVLDEPCMGTDVEQRHAEVVAEILRERGLNLVEMNRGRVARGMPALTAAEALDLLDAAAGAGENRQTPSAQQVRDVERAVQSARDGSLCGLTANDLAVIAWALAITSSKLLDLEDTRAALRRVQEQFAHIEKTITGLSVLIDGVEAERAKGNAP